VAVLLVSLGVCQTGSADWSEDLDRYLESRGLVDLRAMHLSERLDSANSQEAIEIADRLSSIYAELIESARTVDERARWQGAANDLLRRAPEDDALSRRLRIRRAQYVVGERLAEQLRLGKGDAASRGECVSLFREVADDLARVGGVADRNVLRLQRQEERAGADERSLLSQHLSTARQTRSLSFYLAGWSNAYLAELLETPARAEEAIRNFGWLLGANPGQPATIVRMPAGLLRYDHVARSAIGVAWSHATLGHDDQAKQWLDAIQGAEELSSDAEDVLPLWRLVILATLKDWSSFERSLSAFETTGQPLWRRVAAITFSADSPSESDAQHMRQLRDRALAELVGMGDLSSVVALGRLHGLSTLDGSGFVSGCVRGLTIFERARTDGETENTRSLLQAADELALALRAEDADQYPSAAGETSLARAQALLFAARQSEHPRRRDLLIESSKEFERASQFLTNATRASEALYWAIRSLREASDLGATVDVQRRGRLIASLLDSGAEDEQAAMLLVEQLSDGATIDDVMLARLLRIPPASRAYDSARRLAARTLYSLYLDSGQSDRDWHALRYVDVAEPILYDDSQRAVSGDTDAGSRAMTRGRRILAALLGATSPDSRRASSVRQELARVVEHGYALSTEESLELTYRDAEIALAEGRVQDAESALVALESAGSGDAERYVRSLRDFVLRRAVIEWRDAHAEGAGDARVVLAARRLLAVGTSALAKREDATSEESIALRVTLASASVDIWRAAGDESARSNALAWLRQVRDAGVVERTATQLLADLLESENELVAAQEAWRDLAAAVGPPDELWFKARFQFMRLMAQTNPTEAHLLLSQHAVLYPEFGPAPWGEQIRALKESMGTDAEAPAS
jgi:hypothetical protein